MVRLRSAIAIALVCLPLAASAQPAEGGPPNLGRADQIGFDPTGTGCDVDSTSVDDALRELCEGGGGGGGGGTSITLDLDNNGSAESSAISKIALLNYSGLCSESPADALLCDFGTVVLDSDIDTVIELEARLGVNFDVYDSADNFERRIYATNSSSCGGSGVLDGCDVQARIDASKKGYVAHSSSDPVPVIVLPPGLVLVPNELSCGDGTSAEVRVGVSIVGRGSGYAQVSGNATGVGGTVLRWSGAPGGTVLSNKGCDYFEAHSFMIALDKDADGDNSDDAAKGVVISASNSGGGTSQMGRIEDIGCVGNRASPSSTSVCFEVTGAANDDQVDGYQFSGLTARYVGYGVRINNDQFAASVFRDSKIYGQLAAYDQQAGQLRIENGLQQCDTSGCYAVEWGRGATAPGKLSIVNPYSELGTNEHFLHLTDGSGGAAASRHPVEIVGGYISGQCTGTCTHDLINGTSRGDVTVQGTQLHSDNANASFRVLLSGASGNPTEGPTLHWSPVIHAGFGGVSVATLGSQVTVDALSTVDSIDGGTGEKFNDLDLDGQYDSNEPFLGGPGIDFACKSGVVKGFGYNATTGLYSDTCAWYNWHGDSNSALDGAQATASYYVTCTDRNLPDTACPYAGARILIGALHRLGIAARLTAPGGKVHVTNFRSSTGVPLDYAIAIDRGAGVLQGTSTKARYPKVEQWWLKNLYPSAYAKHGPVSRVGTIQETFGVEIVAEQRATLEYVPDPLCPLPDGSGAADGANPGTNLTPLVCSLPRYHGAWVLDDRGRATSNTGGLATEYLDGPNSDQEQPSHRVIWGGAKWIDPCKRTSNTDWTCDVDEDASKYYESAPLWIAGAKSAFTEIDASAGLYCINNAIGAGYDPEATTSFCAEAPMVACWNATGGSGALASAGGCVFDTNGNGAANGGGGADEDFGPCLGFVDGIEYLKEDKGIDVVLAAEVVQSEDVVSGTGDSDAAHGERGTIVPLRFIDTGASCGANNKSVRTGAFPGYSSGLPIDRFLAGSAGQRTVYATTPSLLQNQGGYRGLGFAPAHRLGQWSPTATHAGTTTTTGSATTMGLSAFTIGSAPSTNALVGYTLTIEKGQGDVGFRTISANTGSTVTFNDAYTFSSGDDWEITPHACMSQLEGASEWANNRDETACDTESIAGIYVGVGAGNSGFTDGAFANLSTTNGNKSSLDGWQFGPGTLYGRNVIYQPLRHSLTDLADYQFNDNVVYAGWNQLPVSGLVAIFGSNTAVKRNQFIGGFGYALGAGAFYNSNVVIEENLFSNWSCSGNSLILIAGGRNFTIERNRIAGLSNCPAGIFVQSSDHKIEGVKIRDNTVTGGLFSSAATDSFVAIGDDGASVRQVIVEGNDVSTRNVGMCMIVVETSHGADAATFAIRNNDIEGSQGGHKAVCFGETNTVAPGTSAALDSLAYLPIMTGNTENGGLAIAWASPINTAAQIGDADNLPAGIYHVADDDGTCTDTSSDGTLDGGDTPTNGPAACMWNGTAWSAF